MHAYAAVDPIFLAMNARGQRETNGQLGDFCVKCHAPLAVRSGATTDGLNLDEVPENEKGITCYFCHQIADVDSDHNNGMVVVEDGILRGGIKDPVDTPAHHSAYSPLHDRNSETSSNLCGGCHDVIVEGFPLERSFREWKDTLYARGDLGAPLSCAGCHMNGSRGKASTEGDVPERLLHDHSNPGVDIAITDFPGRELQRSLVEASLFSTLTPEVCVDVSPAGVEVAVTFENVSAGHNFPSGTAHDRRVWVQVVATRGEEVLFETGVIPDGQPVNEFVDPNLWTMHDRIFDDDGNEVHMFWEARSNEGTPMPAPATTNVAAPEYFDPHVTRRFFFTPAAPPTEVRARVFIRPVGLDVLQSLVDSGDLDEKYLARMPTFALGGADITWSADLGTRCNPASRPVAR